MARRKTPAQMLAAARIQLIRAQLADLQYTVSALEADPNDPARIQAVRASIVAMATAAGRYDEAQPQP
jgi:hypothetical protein